MRLFLLIVCTTLLYSIQAQNTLLNICIKNSNQEPIPFTTAVFNHNNFGAISNKNGCLTIPIAKTDSNLTLVFTHLSYETKSLTIASLLNKPLVILNDKVNELNTYTKYGERAITIVKQAINSIDNNYHNNTNYYNAFYRQTHKENNKYVRLIDAQLTLQDKGYATRKKEQLQDAFNITQLRKSFVYEQNGEQHGDHLVDLLLANPIKYEHNSVLNPKLLTLYNFYYITDTNLTNTDSIYYIGFKNKPWQDARNYSGTIVINKGTKFIERIEVFSFANKDNTKSHWQFVNGHDKFTYQNGQLKQATKQYNHYVLGPNHNTVNYIVEEVFELFIENKVTPNLTQTKFYKQSNLYRSAIVYDKSKWEKTSTKYPLSQQIVSDLTKYKTLNQQFSR